MYRHFLVVTLFAYAELSFAAAAGWNCQKNEAGEWSCVTGSPSSTPPVKPSNTQIIQAIPNAQAEPEKLSSPEKTVVIEEPIRKIKNEIKVKYAEKPAPIATSNSSSALAPPDQFSTNPDGWSCTPNSEDGSWNCHLVGIDLKGKPQKMDEIEDYEFRLLDRAFDRNQERAFKNLLTEFQFDPWGKCDSRQRIAKNKIAPLKHLRESTPLDITSDYSELLDGDMTVLKAMLKCVVQINIYSQIWRTSTPCHQCWIRKETSITVKMVWLYSVKLPLCICLRINQPCVMYYLFL